MDWWELYTHCVPTGGPPWLRDFSYASVIDRESKFCQAAPMFRPFQKLIVVLLALWLPLFTGNALAMSIVMQSPGKACHESMTLQTVHHAASHHHMNLAGDISGDMPGDLASGQQPAHSAEQGHSTDKNCGICHLACCSYLATVTSEILPLLPVGQQFALSAVRFQSISIAPLDPPPLVRV